ncbi:hypothetical protein RIF29_38576 [Crotalaria pallida]|uniref:SDE2/SF3A3 SAP domain-containing protein n=1 Tax=Crotalaria pallida TaxID=3830 RepID=A0AAN9HLN7_CROPI
MSVSDTRFSLFPISLIKSLFRDMSLLQPKQSHHTPPSKTNAATTKTRSRQHYGVFESYSRVGGVTNVELNKLELELLCLLEFRVMVLGLERLKSELQSCGLKCGGRGTLQERAVRLFLLKWTPLDKLRKKLLAKK